MALYVLLLSMARRHCEKKPFSHCSNVERLSRASPSSEGDIAGLSHTAKGASIVDVSYCCLPPLPLVSIISSTRHDFMQKSLLINLCQNAPVQFQRQSIESLLFLNLLQTKLSRHNVDRPRHLDKSSAIHRGQVNLTKT